MAVSQNEINEALEMIAGGSSLREAARHLDCPVTTLYVAVKAASPEHYAHAREAQADLDADRIREIGEQAIRGEIEANAARAAIDAYKWSAGKRAPKKFGDKLELSGDPARPFVQRIERVVVDAKPSNPDG